MAIADLLKALEERCEERAALRVHERKLENETDLREIATEVRSIRLQIEDD